MNVLTFANWLPGAEGIYEGLPEDTYRNAPGVNVSSLKAMRLSPAHYRSALEEPKESTSALVVGTLVHKARLEPERLVYAVRPGKWDSWRTKEAQAWRAEMEDKGIPVITPDEDATINRCSSALAGVELINQLAACGWTELSCFKRDTRTGLLLKGRADLVSLDANGRRWACDIKTVRAGGACSIAFAKQVADMDYHLQEAFYTDLFDLDEFRFVAVEKEGHAGVGIYQLDNEAVELGRRTYSALLNKLADAEARGVWESYPTRAIKINLPAWKRRIDGEDVL